MIPIITSLQNPTIKNLVKLRQRRHRDKQGYFLIDGKHALYLALKNNFPVETIFLRRTDSLSIHGQAGNLSYMGSDKILPLAQKQEIQLQPVSQAVFQKIGYGDNPDGILGLAPYMERQNLLCQPNQSLMLQGLYIITEDLEKPGNLGAILRSADGASVTGIIVCNSRTDIYNPNMVRASRGACFTVPIAQANTSEVIEWLNKNHVQILTTFPTATRPYFEVDMCSATAIVVGNEHHGLTDVWHDKASLVIPVCIPMMGQLNSLNVAQTATIFMFEAVRQRKSYLDHQQN
ncbi:MAG: hypothetical protein B6242_06810 [Anaerolineaceae bacterium 4572_78]|nr:MAG: hypothetical protein B6242_06810 [Anaerolineaceae bacterium 4572_78]